MTIRIVQLGSPRARGEGPRLGTVRRPPRGVRVEDRAGLDYFDVWFPNLAPSQELIDEVPHKSDDWFERRYRREMNVPDARRVLDVLAALSHTANFSVGCYCEDESRCHRRFLRALLVERGAKVR